MKNHLLNIFTFVALFCIKVNHCSVISKVTDAQMKKLGWTKYNLEDLNFCINKFEIAKTKERFLSFISLLSYDSDLGKFCGEFVDSVCSKYEGRTDLGNTQPGDGCKFKPTGYMLISGRNNYQNFANFIGDEKVMEGFSYVNSKYPFSTSGYYWKINHLNSLVDKNPSPQRMCTIFISHGLDCTSKMKKYYDKAKEIF